VPAASSTQRAESGMEHGGQIQRANGSGTIDFTVFAVWTCSCQKFNANEANNHDSLGRMKTGYSSRSDITISARLPTDLFWIPVNGDPNEGTFKKDGYKIYFSSSSLQENGMTFVVWL